MPKQDYCSQCGQKKQTRTIWKNHDKIDELMEAHFCYDCVPANKEEKEELKEKWEEDQMAKADLEK